MNFRNNLSISAQQPAGIWIEILLDLYQFGKYCHSARSLPAFENVPHLCVHVPCAQSCLTLRDPMACSPPGSSVHRMLQARILEWVAIFLLQGSSQTGDWTHVSCIFCAGRQILYHSATWEAPHLCDFSLVFPTVFYSFQSTDFIILFTKFIPKCLITFDTIVNRLVFLISFLHWALLMYRDTIDFHMLISYPTILLDMFIHSNNFLVGF